MDCPKKLSKLQRALLATFADGVVLLRVDLPFTRNVTWLPNWQHRNDWCLEYFGKDANIARSATQRALTRLLKRGLIARRGSNVHLYGLPDALNKAVEHITACYPFFALDGLCTRSAGEVSEDWWPILLDKRKRFCREVIPYDCRLLLFFIEDGARSRWLGLKTRERYLKEGLELNPEMVELAVHGLTITKSDAVVGFDAAVVLGKRGRTEETVLRWEYHVDTVSQ